MIFLAAVKTEGEKLRIWIRMRRCAAPMLRRRILMRMQMLALRTRLYMTLRCSASTNATAGVRRHRHLAREF